ncbi:sulfurtransferase complex subunit TusB [Telmatospirillum sp. J64-1]|uniref:sulfurtransferase complex subunit TusB n=1 Tax=Telmatospirillum sp. J64-1 TaxID=2502183 RepID=UPI00115E67A0|nr:sulfurtransferase complex subunit TusB [Telmatospirillum sp. J64-1]
MPVLHMVRASPFAAPALEACLDRVRPGDAVLLMEDAVLAARRGTAPAARLVRTAAEVEGLRLHVLEPDLLARGIAAAELVEAVAVVDDGSFVDLAVGYPTILPWI